MIRSRVFVFLAISLLLVGFLCAEATDPPAGEVADEGTATKKVTELQALTKEVLEKAKTKFNDAEGLKSDVEDQKTKADNAESNARAAATAIEVTERKAEADAVVGKAESELKNCLQLYNAAKLKAEEASNSLNRFVESANALVEKAKIEIPADSSQPNDYAKVIKDAEAVTSEATRLSKQIDESTLLSDQDSAFVKLEDSAKNIQVFKYQTESIAIVSQVETTLKTAETGIQNIPQKKDEVDAIVQAIKPKCKIPLDTLKISLRSLCTTANSQLQTATTNLQEAQQCNTDMQQRKTQLDTILKTLKDTTLEDMAKDEAGNVKGHKRFIDGELQKIKQALLAADNALSSAKDLQQQIQDELSKHSSQSGTKLNEGNPQDNVRTEEVTKTIQNGEAKNPAITKTDQTVLEKSKDTIDKTSEQPVDANLDSTEETKSTQLTDQQTQNPKDDNSELLNKEKLSNITKDITNNPLIGGEVQKRSAANDSAVTVFIPLLVILVISAVLH